MLLCALVVKQPRLRMPGPDSRRGAIRIAGLAFVILVLDQLTKFLVSSNFQVGQSLPAEGFLRLTYVQNTGAAFGIFDGNTFVLAIVSGIALVLLGIFSFNLHRLPFGDTIIAHVALGLMIGGALGNLIDRLVLGYVVDFIDIGPWPVFNLADSAVVVGVGILVYLLLFGDYGENSSYGKTDC